MNFGTVFAGKKFWIGHVTPFRKTYIERVEQNGGSLVIIEDESDLKVGDHLKPQSSALGSVSYTYIDACIKKGELVDPAAHLVCRKEPRPIGSTQRRPQSTRTAFTAEDDHILADWISNSTDQSGNLVYQRLEKLYPQHTWQSWRDRYVKGRLHKDFKKDPRELEAATLQEDHPKTPPVSAPPELEQSDEAISPSAEHVGQPHETETIPIVTEQPNTESLTSLSVRNALKPTGQSEGESREIGQETTLSNLAMIQRPSSSSDGDARNRRSKYVTFSLDEFRELLNGAKRILNIDPARIDEAWEVYAKHEPSHSSTEWKAFFEQRVKPVYLEKRDERRDQGVYSSEVSSSEEGLHERSDENLDERSDKSLEERSDEDSEAENIASEEDASQAEGENGVTEILADDGQRYLSTPTRPNNSLSLKRVYQDSAGMSPSLTGERSPLKRRRLVPEASQDMESVKTKRNADAYNISTEAADDYQATPDREVNQNASTPVDLSLESDQNGTMYSENPSRTETMEPPVPTRAHLQVPENAKFERPRSEYQKRKTSKSLKRAPDTINLQSSIDAQIHSEMSSAALRDERDASSPEQSDRGLEDYTAPENGSISDSDNLESPAISRNAGNTHTVAFTPAAYQASSESKLADQPSLLPAFSVTDLPSTRKQRGKHALQPAGPDSIVAFAAEGPRSSVGTTSADAPEIDIDAWVRNCIDAGWQMEHIKIAFEASSGNIELVDSILMELEHGRPVPQTTRGIWTERDDKALKRDTESSLIPIVKKHGRRLLVERAEFLAALEDNESSLANKEERS